MQPNESYTPPQLSSAETQGATEYYNYVHGSAELEAIKQPYSKLSIVFLVVLLLTFFSPLGAALFLPLLVIGAIAAFKSTTNVQNKSVSSTGHRNPLVSVIRFFLIVGGSIVLLIVGLIALFIAGVSTGLIDFRMGS